MKCDMAVCANEATQVILFYIDLINTKIRCVPVCDNHKDHDNIGLGSFCFQRRIASIEEFMVLQVMLS